MAGADSLTGLGVARALRDEDVTIVGLAADVHAPSCHSSLWHEIVPVGGGNWITAVVATARRYGRMVLMPVTDETVEIVARHARELDGLVDLVIPDEATVTTLLDKTAFHDWARRHGFPVPRSEIVADRAELDAALRRLAFPTVLKPFEPTAAWRAVNGRDKVRLLDSPAAVDRFGFDLFAVAPRFVLQEWVPGRDSDVWFYLTYRDRRGVELAHQVGRKLAQWPVDTGCTALCVTADDEELATLARKLFDAVGMVGVGSLEVKRSSADGRLYITEPTVGRPDLQSNIATAAGVNLTAVAYRDACGLPPGPAPTPRPAVWVHETTLPKALVSALRRGRLDARALGTAVRLRARRSAAFLARGDAGPLRREVARLARVVRSGKPRTGGAPVEPGPDADSRPELAVLSYR